MDLVPALLTTLQRVERKLDRLMQELDIDMAEDELSLDDTPSGLQPDLTSLDGP
jgi:hypothetical protein